jgi:hypothetical protein
MATFQTKYGGKITQEEALRRAGYTRARPTATTTATTPKLTTGSIPQQTAVPKVTRTAAQKATGAAKRKAAKARTKRMRSQMRQNVMSVQPRGTRKRNVGQGTTPVPRRKKRTARDFARFLK